MIIPPAKANERKLRRTFSGLLRAALTDGQPPAAATIIYQTGNPDWHVSAARPPRPEPAKAAAAASDDETSEVLEVRLAPAGQRSRGLDRASPSGLEGGSQVSIHAVFHSREKSAAALRGTLWHEWLEQIRWVEDGVPDDAALRGIAGQHPEILAEVDVDAQLRRFRELLKRPEILSVLSRRNYHPPAALALPTELCDELAAGGGEIRVQTERRFAIREENAILNGSIDRLLLIGDGRRTVAADVTDYKTDVIPLGDEAARQARIEYYRPQLAAYRRAVARFTRLPADQIATRLVFLELAQVVDL
jgi:ATP-dependent exoDNAse (exonuclease V) beta subunit